MQSHRDSRKIDYAAIYIHEIDTPSLSCNAKKGAHVLKLCVYIVNVSILYSYVSSYIDRKYKYRVSILR